MNLILLPIVPCSLLFFSFFIFFLLFPLNECKLMSVEKRKLRYKRRQRKEGKAREGQAERGAMVEGVAVADAGAEIEGGGKAEREVGFEGFIGRPTKER